MELQWWPLLAEEDALHRCSMVRHGMGGGAARSGGAASGLERVASSVAPATIAGEEGSFGEVGTAPQSSKRAKKDMGSKRGVRRSWWRSLLPVGACGDVRRPQVASVVALRGGGGSEGGGGVQEGSGQDRGGAEEV